jgi:hypothetical protein
MAVVRGMTAYFLKFSIFYAARSEAISARVFD